MRFSRPDETRMAVAGRSRWHAIRTNLRPSRTSVRAAASGRLSSHSHTVHTRQPSRRSAAARRRSRRLLARSLSDQKATLLVGNRPARQECACQKQPCTNSATRYFGKTRSGLPGRPLTLTRKRRPSRCRPLRKASSGAVSRWPMRLIKRLRASRLNLSTITPRIGPGRFGEATRWTDSFGLRTSSGHFDEQYARLRIQGRRERH